MTISHIGVDADDTGSGALSSLTVGPFATQGGATDAVWLFYKYEGAAVASVVITSSVGGNTFVERTFVAHSNGDMRSGMFTCVLAAGGAAQTFTLELRDGSNNPVTRQYFFFGAVVKRSTLGWSYFNSVSAQGSSNAPSAGSLSPGGAYAAVAGFGEYAAGTWTAGSGWTAGASGVFAVSFLEHRNAASGATITGNASSTSSMDWGAHMVVLLESAGAAQDLAGAASGQGSASGSLSVPQKQLLTGLRTRASIPAGRGPYARGEYFRMLLRDAARSAVVHSLGGNAAATASAAAALQLLKGLAAAASGSATAQASLSLAVSLAAAAAGAAGGTGTLAHGVLLNGAAGGAGSGGGALSHGVQLGGQGAGSAAASGTLSTNGGVDLAGAAGGLGQAQGSLSLTVSLLATALGAGSATGLLTHAVPLNGAAVGLASGGGQLALSVALQGAALGQASAGGSFDAAVLIGGAAAGVGDAGATLLLSVPITGQAEGLAAAGAGLVLTVLLGGQALGNASASGSWPVEVQLAGGAGGQATATGQLAMFGVTVTSDETWRVRPPPRSWVARSRFQGQRSRTVS